MKELEILNLKFLDGDHPTIIFFSNYPREQVNILDVAINRNDNQLLTDLYINQHTLINICMLNSVTYITISL